MPCAIHTVQCLNAVSDVSDVHKTAPSHSYSYSNTFLPQGHRATKRTVPTCMGQIFPDPPISSNGTGPRREERQIGQNANDSQSVHFHFGREKRHGERRGAMEDGRIGGGVGWSWCVYAYIRAEERRDCEVMNVMYVLCVCMCYVYVCDGCGGGWLAAARGRRFIRSSLSGREQQPLADVEMRGFTVF